MRGVVLLVALAAGLAGCAWAPSSPESSTPRDDAGGARPEHEIGHATAPTAGGTAMPLTWYRPTTARREAPVPVVVLLHGASGDRDDRISQRFRAAFLEAGFGVVGVDQRGHGNNSAELTTELSLLVDDLVLLLDWISANLDWVARDASGSAQDDIVVGTWGYSLGGIQQHLAARDARVDAMVPMDAWNSLWKVFWPQRVVATYWTTSFFSASKIGVVPAYTGDTVRTPSIRWSAEWDAAVGQALATGEWPAPLVADLQRMDVSRIVANVTAPTLYIHGVTDTTWPLGETMRNFEALRARGVPVQLHTFLGGHTRAAVDPPEAFPCGSNEEAAVAWFDLWLRDRAPAPTPDPALALSDGTCIHAEVLPGPAEPVEMGDVALTDPARPVDVAVPLRAGEVVVFGEAVLRFDRFVSPSPEEILYFSLHLRDAGGTGPELSHQVTPLRLGANERAEVTLGLKVVGARVPPGNELVLRIDRHSPWYGSNVRAVPLAATLEGLSLALPVVDVE